MPQLKEVVIVSSARTAIGSFNGVFKDIPATRLGSIVIDAVLQRAKVYYLRILDRPRHGKLLWVQD